MTSNSDFDLSDLDLSAFRVRLRTWIGENIAHLAPASSTEDSRRETNQRMYDAGLLGLTWPTELGGRALSAAHQTVWNDEMRDYQWSLPYSAVTVGICAPTVRDFGTTEQKTRHIPRMLRGDERWTQLLSEPGAGSDLASVSTTATLQGDEYVITGQKVWTSLAVESDLALALVRTSREERRHNGLTMIVVDLKAPGVEIRPLREITGETNFNEVFLDEVKVSPEAILGEVGGGWAVLIAMLTHERLALGAGTTGSRMDADVFETLVELSRDRGVIDEPHVSAALLDLYIEQRILDLNGIRIRRAIETSNPQGPLGSFVKVGTGAAAEAAARASALVAGKATMAWSAKDAAAQEAAHLMLSFPMASIAGGTTEIQKNAIAERLLGLPRGS
ncbi:acyl-CoA dehydrogenase family protein [Williamsia soli]|uniref:acyl-CoA dehydrogenase family protein n=1 Tax=Williamsia soli TaxID=364929 RepID=UPI001A9E97A9|nr:acyl-CoA dehydrogenase family protein [Williamsia soli]